LNIPDFEKTLDILDTWDPEPDENSNSLSNPTKTRGLKKKNSCFGKGKFKHEPIVQVENVFVKFWGIFEKYLTQ